MNKKNITILIVFFIIIVCLFVYLYVNKIKKESFYVDNNVCKIISQKQVGNEYIFCYSCPIMPNVISKQIDTSITPAIITPTISTVVKSTSTTPTSSAVVIPTTISKQTDASKKPQTYDIETLKSAYASGDIGAYLKAYNIAQQK